MSTSATKAARQEEAAAAPRHRRRRGAGRGESSSAAATVDTRPPRRRRRQRRAVRAAATRRRRRGTRPRWCWMLWLSRRRGPGSVAPLRPVAPASCATAAGSPRTNAARTSTTVRASTTESRVGWMGDRRGPRLSLSRTPQRGPPLPPPLSTTHNTPPPSLSLSLCYGDNRRCEVTYVHTPPFSSLSRSPSHHTHTHDFSVSSSFSSCINTVHPLRCGHTHTHTHTYTYTYVADLLRLSRSGATVPVFLSLFLSPVSRSKRTTLRLCLCERRR
ncbi:hypothetical protein NESM_000737000 [Novymonas esmeraldas]|uniref:Uncharacterized protein n=1 Tax=Novymonas esmeraldas TaxID=1808958 RepID=A0AAW0EW54_9TRYP